MNLIRSSLNNLLIDFLLINGLFHLIQSIDVHLDYQQSKLMQLGFDNIFWSTINTTQLETINVSSSCAKSLINVQKALTNGRKWSIKLMSSSGHFPRNALSTGYSDLGDFDQCLSVQWTNDIKTKSTSELGQHCTISFLPTLNRSEWSINPFTRNKVIEPTQEAVFKIGLCTPSSCSQIDIINIFTKALHPHHWHLIKIDQCKIKSSLITRIVESNLYQKLSLIFILALLLVNIYGTLLDWSSGHSSSWTNCFSIIKSYDRLVNPSSSARCQFITKLGISLHLYTLVLHCSGWFFICKLIVFFFDVFLLEFKDNKYLLSFIPIYVYEILFVYGGLTRSLEMWRVTGKSTTIISSFKHIIDKIIQILLLQFVLLTITLISPLIVTGPFSVIALDWTANNCIKSFWANLLFWQNNYRPSQEMCLLHTWSIALEFQLLPLIVTLIHFYKRKPKFAVTLNILIVISGLIYFGLNTLINNLPINFHMGKLDIGTMILFADSIYFPTLMHLWIYLMGPLWTYLIMNDHQIVQQLRKISLSCVILFLTILPFIRLSLENYCKGPTLNSIYVVIYRLLTIIFYSVIIMSSSEQLKSFFAHREDKTLNNNNNNIIKLAVKSTDTQRNHRLLHFVSTVLRSSYYVHTVAIVMVYTYQRKEISSFISLVFIGIKCVIASIIGGFIFHLIVFDPVGKLIWFCKSKPKTS